MMMAFAERLGIIPKTSVIHSSSARRTEGKKLPVDAQATSGFN
jgi:hypothetical protein